MSPPDLTYYYPLEEDDPLTAHMLSRMDGLWHQLTNDEREYLNNRPPPTLTVETDP